MVICAAFADCDNEDFMRSEAFSPLSTYSQASVGWHFFLSFSPGVNTTQTFFSSPGRRSSLRDKKCLYAQHCLGTSGTRTIIPPCRPAAQRRARAGQAAHLVPDVVTPSPCVQMNSHTLETTDCSKPSAKATLPRLNWRDTY